MGNRLAEARNCVIHIIVSKNGITTWSQPSNLLFTLPSYDFYNFKSHILNETLNQLADVLLAGWHSTTSSSSNVDYTFPSLSLQFPSLPHWGIKWYYLDRPLAKFNYITGTGNIPCEFEWDKKKIEGGWMRSSCERKGWRKGEKERKRKRVLSKLSTQML